MYVHADMCEIERVCARIVWALNDMCRIPSLSHIIYICLHACEMECVRNIRVNKCGVQLNRQSTPKSTYTVFIVVFFPLHLTFSFSFSPLKLFERYEFVGRLDDQTHRHSHGVKSFWDKRCFFR